MISSNVSGDTVRLTMSISDFELIYDSVECCRLLTDHIGAMSDSYLLCNGLPPSDPCNDSAFLYVRDLCNIRSMLWRTRELIDWSSLDSSDH